MARTMVVGHLTSCVRGMGKPRLLLTLLRNKSTATASSFKVSDLQIELTKAPRPKPDPDTLVFGREFSDHMLEVDWSEKDGWSTPHIKPLQNFSLHPAAKVFHYAVELYEGLKAYRGPDNRIRIFRPDMNMARMKSTALRATLPLFEGMKAYRDTNNKIRLFRPDCNMERMKKTAARSSLPDFDAGELTSCIKKLISIDQEWVPYSEVSTLYIRPTMIGTEPSVGIAKSNTAKLFVITGPVGPYYPTGFQPVSLLADPKYVRASEGGVGAYKMGSNYAPTIYTQIEALERHKCQQVLWLYGPEHRVTEVGTMNLFMFWDNEQGVRELVTPPLSSGLILPGVTRLSLLELARKWGEFKVSEQDFTMATIVKALKENRIKELFGAGTACVVNPVEKIIYQGENLHIPTMEEGALLTSRFFKELTDIQDFDGGELTSCIKKLLSVDQEWVPYSEVSTLYIRPTFIGTDPSLGVTKSSTAKLFVITGPVGPYYPTGFKPVSLLADPKYVRASEGGVGAYKMGSNYAPTIYTQIEALERHQCQQVLWLYGPEHRVTEVGTMNLFMFWDNEQGEHELVTPPLSSGLILPGVTRLSLLELARKWGEFKVNEREITMPTIVKALKEKRVKELFGAGTACIVCPVEKIIYQGESFHIPTMDGGAPLTSRFYKELTDIQFGRQPHNWSVEID